MIQLALRNGVGVAVTVILISIFGFISLFRVPIQMTPDLSTTSLSVQTSWPGATPQDIEKEIIIEQERYLRSIPDLEKMTSSASTGSAEIILEFRVGSVLDELLVRVNNALSQVPSYPENVDQPRIITSSASDQPIAWFSIKPLPGRDDVDIVAMQDFVEDYIITDLERTPGVSQAEVFGGAARQLRIYIDPSKLAERELTLSDVRNAIRSRNRDVSGGDFDEGKRRYLIRTMGRFHSVDDVEDTLVAYREGAPIYLRDLGHVELTRAEVRGLVRHNGEPALATNVRRQPGTNILEVMREVKQTIVRLNETTLKDAGLAIRQVSDDTIYIEEAVELVRQNLLLGGVLATFMLLLFLRSVTATGIGALAVPICTICSFLGLTMAGRTINVISLAGIAFAIGMTVDNSIVVLENIYRHRMMGKDTRTAAYDGVREVWGAVLASTLTTVCVFLPIVFVEEEAGQLFKDIAIAITSAIVFSMVVAVTVIPSASARLMHRVGRTPKTEFGRQFQDLGGIVTLSSRFVDVVIWALKWLMGGVVRRVVLVGVMAIFSIVIAVQLAPKTEYLPDGSQNLIFAIVAPPAGYNLDEMTRIGQQIENEYKQHIQTSPEAFENGETTVPPIQEFFFVSTPQNIFVVTKTVNPEHIGTLSGVLTQRLQQVPGVIAFAFQRSIFEGGLASTRSIDFDISGERLPQLYDVAFRAFMRVITTWNREAQNGDVWNARPEPASLSLGQPLLEIRPDWRRAAELGINSQDLGYTVWAMTDGAFVDEFFLGDDKIDMYLYSTSGTVDRTQDLSNLPLYTRAGTTVPLSSVASIVPTVSTETIRRVDRQRTITLSMTPPKSIALESAVDHINEELVVGMPERGELPAGVQLRIAGASDKLAATREALGGNFMLAVLIAYLLMVALFKHWGYPLVIIMSVPLGIVGGIVGLWLINHAGTLFGWLGFENIYQPLDVLTMLGFVVLVGTVVNNPILLVERTLQLTREEGMEPREAVVEATRTRIRPIMMSTMTTALGLAPLVFLPGSGAELYRGLGTVVLFGLFFSTLFTLTFIPSLLSLTMQAGHKSAAAFDRATASWREEPGEEQE